MFVAVSENRVGCVEVWFADSDAEMNVAVNTRESDEYFQDEESTVDSVREMYEDAGYTVEVYV